MSKTIGAHNLRATLVEMVLLTMLLLIVLFVALKPVTTTSGRDRNPAITL
jgi:hypothetical protein